MEDLKIGQKVEKKNIINLNIIHIFYLNKNLNKYFKYFPIIIIVIIKLKKI